MSVEFQKTAGKEKSEYIDYIHAIDRWDWHDYDYTKWPSADMSFSDLVKGEERDLWPFKPDISQTHWIDLYTTKSGAERELLTIQSRFPYPEELEGVTDWKEEIETIKEIQDSYNTDKDEFQEYLEEYNIQSLEHLTHIAKVAELSNKVYWENHQAMWDEETRKSKETINKIVEDAKENGILNSFKNISLEDWAGANAKLASGSTIEDILNVLNIERPIWDEITAEWTARMSRDTTFAIAKVYGDAFVNSNIGKFALENSNNSGTVSGAEEISFEKWVEIQEAINALSTQGQDANSVLSSFGMSAADWGILGMQMHTKMNTDVKLYEKHDEYSQIYAAKYAGVTSADDIEF